MKEGIPALISEKIELERCIYQLKGLETGQRTDDVERLRAALEQLISQSEDVDSRLRGVKERVETASLSSAVDSGSMQTLEKLHRELSALQTTLRRQKTQTEERLRARIHKLHLWSSVDEGESARLDNLRREEALVGDGNAHADRIIMAGTSILASLDRQRSSLHRVFSELRHIGTELRASEWTAVAVRKRLQSDTKLVLLLMLVTIVLVIGVYCLIRRK